MGTTPPAAGHIQMLNSDVMFRNRIRRDRVKAVPSGAGSGRKRDSGRPKGRHYSTCGVTTSNSTKIYEQ